jgi:hypothetical protein
MYFYWLIQQKCNFSKVQRKIPEDGPDGPKYVGANIRYFNCKFKHFICLIKGAFVGKKEFWRRQNARYINKKIAEDILVSDFVQKKVMEHIYNPVSRSRWIRCS